MTPRQAVAFVQKNGIVLESGRGPVPNLAETVAGGRIKGSWWNHPKANAIFACSRTIRSSKDVLICRLVAGKVTYVHRRLWPALARLSGQLKADQLAPIREIHTAEGKHRVEITAFSEWVSAKVKREAASLPVEEAVSQLAGAGFPKLAMTPHTAK